MDSSVKELYKKVFTIGIPVSIENMIYSLMNFIDVFMVGKENVALGLGTAAVAGLGFANQVFMIFIDWTVEVEYLPLNTMEKKIIKIWKSVWE